MSVRGLTFTKDPVCGMKVDPSTAKFVSKQNGDRIAFCSSHCKTRFDANPHAFARLASESVDPVCGMRVKTESARFTSAAAEKQFYFCSSGCKQKFDADSSRYHRTSMPQIKSLSTRLPRPKNTSVQWIPKSNPMS